MVVGIETAGLVLAAFPLIVACLKRLGEGARTIKNWRRYSRELTSYARKIGTQHVIYLTTTEHLLNGIVESGEDLRAMLFDPSAAAWQNPDFIDRLQTRLDYAYKNYMETAENMMQTLNELKKVFNLDSEGKVSDLRIPTLRFPKETSRLFSKVIQIPWHVFGNPKGFTFDVVVRPGRPELESSTFSTQLSLDECWPTKFCH